MSGVYFSNQAAVESESGVGTLARILYENIARVGTVSASTEEVDYPAVSAADPDTFAAWMGTALPAWWKVDVGSAVPVNACGIAAHDLGSKGCSVVVESSDNDSTWTPRSDTEVILGDNAVLLLFPSATARYWRAYITGAGGVPQACVIAFGTALVMQRGLYGGHTPIALARETVLQNHFSDSGQFVGSDYRRKGYVSKASYKNLTAAWVRTYFDPFIESARVYPYFFAWRPTTWPLEIAYARTAVDIRPSNMGKKDLMEVDWELKGHSNE